MAQEMNIDDKINSRQQNTTLKPTDWANEHNKKRVDFFFMKCEFKNGNDNTF